MSYRTYIQYKDIEGAVPLFIIGVTLNVLLAWYGYASIIDYSLTSLGFFIGYAIMIYFIYYFALAMYNNVFDKNATNDYLIIIYLAASILIPMFAYYFMYSYVVGPVVLWDFLLSNWIQLLVIHGISFLVQLAGSKLIKLKPAV